MSLANAALDPDIETIFLMAKEQFSHINGTLLRQIATFGGDLENFVPSVVKTALQTRVRELQKQKSAKVQMGDLRDT
jgi:pantetheine-phosphate adenylyltransferase